MGKKIIYLVDDDDDDRILIREAVESTVDKPTIIEFNNGIDFIEQLKSDGFKSNYALVLLDINMPRMNGLEVLSALRSDVKSLVHVIAISTASEKDFVDNIMAKGASDFFKKPASIEGLTELAEKIKSVLGELV